MDAERSLSNAGGRRSRSGQVAALVGLAGFMAVCSAMTFVVGALAPYLTTDAGLSVAHIGLLTASVYGTGALLSLRAGRLTDRLSAAPALLAATGCVAVGFTLVAVAPGLPAMLVGAVVAGIALALSNPVTNHVIVGSFEPGHRGAALGAKQAGVPFAAMLAGGMLPSVAVAWGWRMSIATVAAAALVVGFLCTTLVERPGDRPEPRVSPPAAGTSVERLGLLNPLGFLMGFVTACVGAYVVLYAVTELGQSTRTAGLLLTVVGVTGAVARIVWASLAERGRGLRSWFRIMNGAAVTAGLLTLAARHVATWLIWPAAVLVGASIFVYTALGMLALVIAVPRSRIGAATGALFKSFLGGLLVGPLVFGALADVTGSYTAGWLVVLALLLVGSALTWLPSFLKAPDEPETQPVSAGAV